MSKLYRFRVNWGARYSGYFKVGVSTIAPASNSAGYDRLGDPLAGPSYSGLYDTISDDKYGVVDFVSTRGRDDTFANLLAGQLDVTMNDVYPGRYNPKNPLSPLVGKILPLRPCNLGCSTDGGSTWIDLFNGFLDETSSDVDWDSGTVKMTFKDLFVILDRTKNATIASTGPTTVGAAIGLCLNAINWPLRSLATGSNIPDFSVDPGTSLLEAIGGLLTVDMGYFFISRTGVATYWDRYQAARKTSIGTFTVAEAGNPGVNLDNLRNTATATMEGSTQQAYQDPISIGQYGANAWDDVTSAYFNSDTDALSFCQARVALGATPTTPVWTFKLEEDPASSVNLGLLLASEFLDRVTVNAWGQTSDYHVQKIVHRGAGGTLHNVDWVLADRPVNLPFIVGVSTIAPATDTAGYDRVWY